MTCLGRVGVIFSPYGHLRDISCRRYQCTDRECAASAAARWLSDARLSPPRREASDEAGEKEDATRENGLRDAVSLEGLLRGGAKNLKNLLRGGRNFPSRGNSRNSRWGAEASSPVAARTPVPWSNPTPNPAPLMRGG